ncbi:ATP-binding cassette domain-containing protein, partial [Dickeya ananatis]
MEDAEMTVQSPYLSFRGIGKVFPGVKALDDISFDCHAGQIHALMGENGAGK